MVARPFQGATFKVLGIAALALLMLIPLAQVNGLVGEREGRAREATQKIAERWGGEQRVGAPVLVVPVRRQVLQDKVWTTFEEREYVLADRVAIVGKLATDLRRYGIYDTAIYTADLNLEGRFAAADIAALASPGAEPQWQRAELRVPIADVRGIRRVSALHFGDRDLAFGPGTDGVAVVAAISAPASLDPAKLPETVPFAFTLTLAGTERFAVLPLARETDVHVTSPWPDPGFDGAFLPATRRVETTGFEAEWQVLDLNRPLAQHWRESENVGPALAASAFGFTLTQPAGAYQQNVRAGKYGVLFIALTFVAFFLFEVLRGLRVHPVQYLLVGLALCTFYVVLLALSEQIGFVLAYSIAAACVVAMVGGYAGVVLAARRAGLVLGALLALIYALLYGLVVSEDYALLMGSLALLAAIAALMYLTRRVDWYSLSAAPAR
ncbi:MAG TPA: cell envelope integrity protein CreD [Rhodanobacteraceae bacterium]|nr:cell envelope integrity protein CreD [Rhodanobacteraceae bacterium]